MESNINIKRTNNNTNHFMDHTVPANSFKPKQKVTIPPPRSWGLQESIIFGLVLLILLLSIFAASIFFNIFPIGSWGNNSSVSSQSSTSISKSTQNGNSVSISTSSNSITTTSQTQSITTSALVTSSAKSTSTGITTSSNSTTSASTSSNSISTSTASTSSTTTSVVVNGNTKIYFPKGDTVGVVGRNFTGTDDTEKLIFALLERIKGPTAEEQSAGYKKDINFSGDSNCDGNWFEISSPSSSTLELKFCRPFPLIGSVADALMEQSIIKSVTDNTGYTKVIILNPSGNCVFNQAGDNKCLK